MANETYVTVRGFTGADPRLFRNEDGGTTVLFRVGVTPRSFNRKSEKFEDGVTTWYSIRCYGPLADNVINSVFRGTPVVVRGKLSHRESVDKEGVNRYEITVVADSVGIDLNTGQARFTSVKNQRLDAVHGEPAGSASEVPVADEEPPYSADDPLEYSTDPAGNLAGVS